MSNKLKKLFIKTDEDLIKDNELFKKVNFGDTQPSPADERDFVACVGSIDKIKFPEEYLAPETEILDQGSIGSCVAHSCATALAQGEKVLINNNNDYSRGYIYGNRKDSDYQGEGMHVRQALKQLNHCGDVIYSDFPYNKKYPQVKALIEKQKDELAAKALPHAIIDYYRCYDEKQIKNAVMGAGGVLICVPVYTDFSRDLHKTETKKLRGYHAMIIVGWTKEGKWIVQNSWGKSWGYNGRLLMDEDYPVDEYWAITVNTPDIEPVPKKKTIWEKIIEFIVGIFNKIFKK